MTMQIGDRVKPVDKTIGFGLDKCKEWNSVGKEQGYLYISGEHSEGYVLNAFEHRDGGSLYRFEDVIPYNKESKEFEELKEGVYVKDLEIGVEWYQSNLFKKSLKQNDDIVCFSHMDKKFVYTLNKKDIEKLYQYLAKVLDYCNEI